MAYGVAAVHDAIRGGDALFRIAQQRVVRPDRRSELAVGLGCVDTCREKRDIELAKGVAALTERPTVGRSAVGEGFGEPGQHHDLLVAVVRQPVRSAVRSGQREVRRHLTRRRRPGRPLPQACTVSHPVRRTPPDTQQRRSLFLA